MKRILALLFCLVISQCAFATEWFWYYVYVQTEYPQGPWTRTDILGKYDSYEYLHPLQFNGLFGTSDSREDIANEIFRH